jgi:multiple sugar transport system permease protein
VKLDRIGDMDMIKVSQKKNKKGNALLKRLYTDRVSYIMLLPYALVFFVFIILPVIASIAFSFTSFNMLQMPKFNGLTNYIRLFLDDDVFTIAVTNTLIFALITGPLGYFLCFVLAWFINELTPKVRAFVTLVFYAPSLAGNVFFIWKFIFSGDIYGIVNSWLISLGIINEPINWLTDPKYGMTVMIVVLLWMSAGAGFLTFIAGLQSMNLELFEAGAIDGIKNRFQELWYITLPQMKPQLLLGAVFTISSAFAVGYQCAALTGFPSTDNSTHTVLLHILDYSLTRFEMGYASAIQVVLFIAMLAVWYLTNKIMSNWGTD